MTINSVDEIRNLWDEYEFAIHKDDAFNSSRIILDIISLTVSNIYATAREISRISAIRRQKGDSHANK